MCGSNLCQGNERSIDPARVFEHVPINVAGWPGCAGSKEYFGETKCDCERIANGENLGRVIKGIEFEAGPVLAKMSMESPRTRNRSRWPESAEKIDMDRSFKNSADFRMNQQNFKLSDFGIETKPSHGAEQCKAGSRYGQIANMQLQQVQMRPGRRVGPGSSGGSGSLQVACSRSRLTSNGSALTGNSQPRRSPSQSQSIGQLQNVTGDRFQASSPSNLTGSGGSMLQPAVSSVPSPSYWSHYSGQESGVNAPIVVFSENRLPVNGSSEKMLV